MEALEALPTMNPLNAPVEVCEQAKERFLQFLNEFQVSDNSEPEPSQLSQGSGDGAPPPRDQQAGRGAGRALLLQRLDGSQTNVTLATCSPQAASSARAAPPRMSISSS